MDATVNLLDRDSLINWLAENDPNGCYADDDATAEWGGPHALDVLQDLYYSAIGWVVEPEPVEAAQVRVVYTDAPENYDYNTVLSSIHVASEPRNDFYRSEWRRVELTEREAGYYADYQIGRYRSGAYVVVDEAGFQAWFTPSLLYRS